MQVTGREYFSYRPDAAGDDDAEAGGDSEYPTAAGEEGDSEEGEEGDEGTKATKVGWGRSLAALPSSRLRLGL